jgi:DnaJ-class molecular chaperone
MTNFVECDECKGLGRKVVSVTTWVDHRPIDHMETRNCDHCHGTGHVEIKETPHIQARPKRVRDW